MTTRGGGKKNTLKIDVIAWSFLIETKKKKAPSSLTVVRQGKASIANSSGNSKQASGSSGGGGGGSCGTKADWPLVAPPPL